MPVEMKKCKNHEAWLKHRTKYLGGSDVACILGLSSWKTNLQLYREKKGIVKPDDLSDNPLVEYGSKAEEHIRALFTLDHSELTVEYVENNSWHNSKYPFAAASLDGWSQEKETDRKGILEIKTANITSKAQAEKWKDGKIPDNYYCQVLFYLAVTEFDYVDLRANLKYDLPDKDLFIITKDFHIERTDPNVEDDIATIMEATAKFAERLKKNEEPPLLLSL